MGRAQSQALRGVFGGNRFTIALYRGIFYGEKIYINQVKCIKSKDFCHFIWILILYYISLFRNNLKKIFQIESCCSYLGPIAKGMHRG